MKKITSKLSKTPYLILFTILIGITVSSAYAITITLGGDAIVTEDLHVTGAITGPTITSLAALSSGSAICPQENIEHWDKIIFSPSVVIENLDSQVNPLRLEVDPPFEYDIKVLDDPNEVAWLEQKVANKLNDLGYRVVGDPVTPLEIFILEVQYAIVCAEIPP